MLSKITRKRYLELRASQASCATCMDLPHLDKDWRYNEELDALQCVACFEAHQGYRCEQCYGKRPKAARLCNACAKKLKEVLIYKNHGDCKDCGRSLRGRGSKLNPDTLLLECSWCKKSRDLQ